MKSYREKYYVSATANTKKVPSKVLCTLVLFFSNNKQFGDRVA